MTMTLDHPALAASRDRLWAAVDQLTRPTTRAVARDDGTVVQAAVPSLWDQACEAAAGQAGEGGGARTGAANERNLVDLDLVAVRHLIASTTARVLRGWGLDPRPLPVARQMRALAAHAVTHDQDNLWWWEYRFSAWARLLSQLLAVGERRPTPLRLRNSACPECAVRHVTVESDDGPVVVPALLVDFQNGVVRAAQCTACGATWWRGDDLGRLADTLGA